MADLRPRRSAGRAGGPGIGEEVQHVHLPPGGADALLSEIPVHRLLGKKAGVLEVHGLDLEGQILVPDLPLSREPPLFPAAAAGAGAEVTPVGTLPAAMGPGRIPDSLGVRAHQELVPPAFQLFPPAAVQQFIVLPPIGNPHGLSLPGFLLMQKITLLYTSYWQPSTKEV